MNASHTSNGSRSKHPLAALGVRLAENLNPPQRLSVAEWAEAHRYLSSEASALPGKYRLAFCPLQREPQEAVTDQDVSSIVLCWAAQTGGKTEILNNIVGFFIAQEPAPILVVQPTVEFAESWSKERLAPMLRDTPALHDLVRDPRSRDSGNTVAMKMFPGGSVAVVGANAPAGLAGRPRRVVLLDEVDRYPASAGTEGDPCALAIKRTESFTNAVVVMTSTPTIKHASRIYTEFQQSDQRYWFVTCPKCEETQTLKWNQVRWPDGKPEEARYCCEHCRAELTDEDRVKMVLTGEWRPTAPFTGKRGYHLNGLYSPFKSKKGFKNRLHQAVVGFLEAKRGGPSTLKTWVNTFLAETWEETGFSLESDPIFKRREQYGPELPQEVIVLTAGVDIQDQWMEAEVVGWGAEEESWGIATIRVPGSPSVKSTWAAMESELQRVRKRVDGVDLRVSSAFWDSGAHTKAVYAYLRNKAVRSWYPCKGIGGAGRPLVGRFSRQKNAGVLVFPIGVDTGKELIYSRLQLEETGPGYMHFPMTYEEEFFKQLTSEKKVSKLVKGVRVIAWEKKEENARNEALDCRVYATAAFVFRNFDLKRLARKFATVAKAEPEPPNEPEASEPPAREPVVPLKAQAQKHGFRRTGGRSFVSGWRRW